MRHHLQAATSEFAVLAMAGQCLHAHPLPVTMIVCLCLWAVLFLSSYDKDVDMY